MVSPLTGDCKVLGPFFFVINIDKFYDKAKTLGNPRFLDNLIAGSDVERGMDIKMRDHANDAYSVEFMVKLRQKFPWLTKWPVIPPVKSWDGQNDNLCFFKLLG